MLLNKKQSLILIVALTLFGALVRFYNLNWGAPFYFHPDERNIASAVSQLSFPNHMNPHFFAYGSLPIYSIYFLGVLSNILFHCVNTTCHPTTVLFEQAIVISRIFSAIFSVLLIPLIFVITQKLWNEQAAILAAVLTTMSVGLIQFAHFGTFEMWLTFFTVLLFWLCLQINENITIKRLILFAIVSGILVATKISHLVILPIPLLLLVVNQVRNRKFLIHALGSLLTFAVICAAFYFLTNPFVVFDYHGFRDSINYESSVALGTLKVFYTGEFYNVTPVLFQFLHVYPFLLNPLITILLIPAFLYVFWQSLVRKNSNLALLFVFFGILFTSQAVLYVKWTRYMVPTLPFTYIMVAIMLDAFFTKLKKHQALSSVSEVIVLTTCILFALSFVITVYIRPDTRVDAKDFAAAKISSASPILSEVYDLGITPFNNNFPNITLFNFYDLDNNAPDATEGILNADIADANYIVLPSQRIMKTRLTNAKQFPHGHEFYQKLFAGQLGFKKIYETPCDIFCKITYLGNPIYSFEETANVFDRPTFFIFKRI